MRLVLFLCLAEIVSMAGFSSFAALLPLFQSSWGLTHTEAGWISGILFVGYVGAVPVLVTLTDRVDARRVYIVAALVTAAAHGGYIFFADGFWTALILRAVAGLGLAGTYMPGLRMLTDRMAPQWASRGLAFYTASFGVGVSVSYVAAGALGATDWRGAFALAALGALAAAAMAAFGVRPVALEGRRDGHLLDFRPVLVSRRAMGYVLAYAAHNWELFAYRAWVVAFLVFCLDGRGGGATATTVAAIVALAGVPASILGNEMALRFERHRVVIAVMLSSALLAPLVGLSAELPFSAVVGLSLLYGVMVAGDSAAITTGALQASPPGYQGATMAVHSCVGFVGAVAGPLAVGAVLDVVEPGRLGWVLAFATIGGSGFVGAAIIAFLNRRRRLA